MRHTVRLSSVDRSGGELYKPGRGSRKLRCTRRRAGPPSPAEVGRVLVWSCGGGGVLLGEREGEGKRNDGLCKPTKQKQPPRVFIIVQPIHKLMQL
jgi:hypothetical protein